jgi:hypothetical protein
MLKKQWSNRFTEASFVLLQNRDRWLHLHNSEISMLLNGHCGFDLSDGYINYVVAFCRSLSSGCFDGLSNDLQSLIMDIEDEFSQPELAKVKNKEVLNAVGGSGMAFQQAMAFIELENAGVFDGEEWYN